VFDCVSVGGEVMSAKSTGLLAVAAVVAALILVKVAFCRGRILPPPEGMRIGALRDGSAVRSGLISAAHNGWGTAIMEGILIIAAIFGAGFAAGYFVRHRISVRRRRRYGSPQRGI
jgi:hypothetical protein